jgi:hypothetical protein
MLVVSLMLVDFLADFPLSPIIKALWAADIHPPGDAVLVPDAFAVPVAEEIADGDPVAAGAGEAQAIESDENLSDITSAVEPQNDFLVA